MTVAVVEGNCAECAAPHGLTLELGDSTDLTLSVWTCRRCGELNAMAYNHQTERFRSTEVVELLPFAPE